MAIMNPETPPLLRGSNESENDFWYLLKEQLSDEFYVFHGLPYLSRDAKQGEVDFLVVHRRLGFLNIECKGWGVQRTEDGEWYRLKGGGARREPLSRTPTEQARDQIEDIVAELQGPARRMLKTSFGKFPLVYGWALAFPKAILDDDLPVGLKEEILIDGDDLEDLEAKVKGAMRFYHRKFEGVDNKRLDEHAFARFCSLISPTVDMPPLLSKQIERESRQIKRLSKEQAELIRNLMGNQRLRVRGGAGTGKTVMALHGARLLAAEGRDVLLTCFNSKLAEFLRESVAAWPEVSGTIDVDNFHGLCARAGDELDGGLDYPSRHATKEVRRKFWQETAPYALMRALDSDKSSLGNWDAIIVDEAQDFAADWWDILEVGLRDDGKIAIFYDESQTLFEHSAAIPEWSAEFMLHKNFRNTKAIAEPVQKLSDTEMKPHSDCPDGETPSVYQQQSPSKTRQKVGKLLTTLHDKQRLNYDHIAILSPHSPGNSAIQGATELDGHPIVHDIDEWYAGDGVLHTTISAFKGLQAEVIILVDIDPDDPRCSRNARYVAASRAINRLHVFEKGHWLKLHNG